MELGIGISKAVTDFSNLYGEAVQLETITVGTTQDAWNDGEVAWTTSTITVLIGPVNRNDTWFKTGLLQEGDLTMLVKSSDTIKLRDRVVHNSITYEDVDLRINRLQNAVINQTAALKRLSDN